TGGDGNCFRATQQRTSHAPGPMKELPGIFLACCRHLVGRTNPICPLPTGCRQHVGWKTLFVIFLVLALNDYSRAQDSVTTLAGLALVRGATNGTGTNAVFSDPAAIVVDANGNFFVADSQNHAIRKVTTNGVVTTFAGKLGVAGSANGTGTSAQFDSPSGLAFDADGNLFVSDTGNS